MQQKEETMWKLSNRLGSMTVPTRILKDITENQQKYR